MSTQARDRVQDSPQRPEADVEEAFDRLVEEGETRLARPLLSQLSTGLLGGIDVGAGLLAYLVIDAQTHSPLAAGVAFSLGFAVLALARGELFTENFLVPVTALVSRRGTPAQLLRLWGITLAMNLVGGWIVAGLIVVARPDLRSAAREAGAHYAALGVSGRSLALAVLAGTVITLMTRMQHASDNMGIKVFAAIVMGSVLAGAQLFHCVLDSLLMFAALISGAPFGYADWLGALAFSALGNLAGGLGLVTAVRLLRVPHRIAEQRDTADDTDRND